MFDFIFLIVYPTVIIVISILNLLYFNIIRSDSDQTLLEEWSHQGMFCLPFFAHYVNISVPYKPLQ